MTEPGTFLISVRPLALTLTSGHRVRNHPTVVHEQYKSPTDEHSQTIHGW